MINCHTEKQNKNKSKKRFVGVTEKYLKTEESLNTYDGSYRREINVQNALEYSFRDGLCYLRNESIHESFPSEHARSADFIRSGKAYTSFNLLRLLNFFLRELLASLNLKQ